MDDFILREAAIKRMKELHFGCKDFHICGGVLLELNALEAIPAADVRPVVRAEWEITEHDSGSGKICFHCPECGADEWRFRCDKTNFCPNCGADMRGD